jgi:hypothetical protein
MTHALSVPTTMKVNLLSTIQTRHRQLNTLPYYDPRYSHHFPYFSYGTIDLMMRDSRVRYALQLIKGPIYAYTKFFSQEEADDPAVQQAIIDLEYHYSYKIESEDAEIEEFVITTLNRFWNEGALKALKAVEWGYSPNQVLYKRDPKTGEIQYDRLINYGVHHVKPVVRNYSTLGIFIKNQDKYIPIPKAFVHVHQREFDAFVGQSRLTGAHIPWHETWNLGGARDIRRNWFFRNSYDGGTLYVPQETIQDEETGETYTSTELGARILEAAHTGSYRIFPKPATAQGKNERTWDYEPPKSSTTPQGMLEYIQDLRIEILEGLGIPPEVVENASSTGLGSASGRKIPLIAFYASLAPISIELIDDVCRQIIDPLLKVNGKEPAYEVSRIIPKTYDPNMAGGIDGFDQNADVTTPNEERQ